MAMLGLVNGDGNGYSLLGSLGIGRAVGAGFRICRAGRAVLTMGMAGVGFGSAPGAMWSQLMAQNLFRPGGRCFANDGNNMKKWTNRRDACFAAGVRAGKLAPEEAGRAWAFLAGHLEGLGEKDVPKFLDLLAGVRAATIYARGGTGTKDEARLFPDEPAGPVEIGVNH